MPPPSPAVLSQHKKFGGDTAVSPGAGGQHVPSVAPPSVEVVSIRKRGMPLSLVLIITIIALLVGFTVGVVVGKW
jgi:hypothetical protein